MSEQFDATLSEEIYEALQVIFPHHQPDPAFVDRLGHRLSEQVKQFPTRRHRALLLVSPLAWGAIGLFFILALVWTITTLLPDFEPAGGIKPTPSPTVEATRMPTQTKVGEAINLPALVGTPVPGSQDVINAANASQITLLAEWGRGFISDDLALSPDGKFLASIPQVGPLKLYDTVTGILLAQLETQVGINSRVRFSLDGKLVAVGGWKMESSESYIGVVQIWDMATRESIMTLDGFSQYVLGIAFSPDGLTLATGEGNGYGYPGAAKLWNIATGEMLQEFGRPGMENSQTYWTVYDVAFSPDGSVLVTANGDGSIVSWDVANHMQKAILTNPGTFPIRISFSPDGKYLAVAEVPGSNEKADLRVLDVSTGTTLFIHEVQSVRSVVFNPNGQILASIGYLGNVMLWEVESGKLLATIAGTGSPGLAFSPDGTMLITGSDHGDGTIKVWGIPP